MRRRPLWGLPLFLSLAASFGPSCGKRADPLAPYVKTPQAPGGTEAAQVGDEVEIRVTAPRLTTEGRPLPVIELEWLQAPPEGAFGKVAISLLREEVAPGEIRTKRFKRPSSEARFSVRASAGKAQSAPTAPLLFKPAPIPPTPTSLQATNTTTGVELRWSNPPGAEPWPQPTPNPSPQTSPSPQSSPPRVGATPNPAESKTMGRPAAGPSPSAVAETGMAKPSAPDVAAPASTRPGGSPTPSPTPQAPLAPPTGIRIFRTDGAPRLAREPLQASTWLDAGPKPGDQPCYSLRYATSFKPLVESAATESVCVIVQDIVPPEPPGRLVGDLSATFVELSWAGSASPDVAFYRIYRSTEMEARFMVIETKGPLLRVRDTNMTPGPRNYEIVAVDKEGNESPPTPPLKIIVP